MKTGIRISEFFKNTNNIVKTVLFLFASEIMCVAAQIIQNIPNCQGIDIPLRYLWLGFEKKYLLLFVAVFFVLWIISDSKTANLLFRYRYLVAFIVFLLCICFEINGSSIGLWCNYYGIEDKDIIYGLSRSIRSDEWAVQTPMLFSQYMDEASNFPYFSQTVRATSTDVFTLYGQPVRNILILFRPFYIGYLILPIGKGLAFFWCGRWIALFMVSFELGRWITQDKRYLSLAYATVVTFAPVVQWWFAINGFVEMLIFGQMAVLLFGRYIKTDSYRKRVLYAAIIAWCGGVYALTFYPAWQLPFGYVYLTVVIAMMIAEKRKNMFCRKDIFILLVCIIVIGIFFLYYYSKSAFTITAVTRTVYPGARFEVGGDNFERGINYTASILFSFLDYSNISNLTEAAFFISLFPLSIILPIVYMIKRRKPDVYCISFLTLTLFFTVYCRFGFPKWLSKITFMYLSPSCRVLVAWHFVQVLLLFRGIAIFSDEIKCKDKHSIKDWVEGIVFTGLSLACSVYLVRFSYLLNTDYWKVEMLVFQTVVFFVMFETAYFAFAGKTKWFIGCMIGISVLSGSLINPVRKGVDSVLEFPLITELHEIEEQDPQADWIIEGENSFYNNVGLLAGLDSVNCTNVYPYRERWESVAPGSIYFYDRYAHINISLTEDESQIVSTDAIDGFHVFLNRSDFKKLGIKYILTKNDYSDLTLLRDVGDFHVYVVGE